MPAFAHDIVAAYLECALFADAPEAWKAKQIPFVLPATLRQAYRDTGEFKMAAERAGIDITLFDPVQVGHDFWYSRQGHGTGFWDRDEVYGEDGDRLAAIARCFGVQQLYCHGRWWGITS